MANDSWYVQYRSLQHLCGTANRCGQGCYDISAQPLVSVDKINRDAETVTLYFYHGGSQTAKEVPRSLSRSDARPHQSFQVRLFMTLTPCQCRLILIHSSLHTDTPGRVDKSTVLQAIQSTGQSYDVARETLKHVSVDASGKVEVEDWVEVGLKRSTICLTDSELSAVECQIAITRFHFVENESRKGNRARIQR